MKATETIKNHAKRFWRDEDGFLGALIGGAVSLIGASKKRRKDKADSLTEGWRVRQSAKSGGFNPLEYLRATGGAGQRAASFGGSAPLASFAMLGEGFGNMLQRNMEGREEKQSSVDDDLREIKQDQLRGFTSLALPRTTNRRVGAMRRTPKSDGSAMYEESDPAYDLAGNIHTPALAMEGAFRTHPDYSDAEIIEQRYGDIMQELSGAQNAMADFHYNNPTYPEKIQSITGVVNRTAEMFLPETVSDYIMPDTLKRLPPLSIDYMSTLPRPSYLGRKQWLNQ